MSDAGIKAKVLAKLQYPGWRIDYPLAALLPLV